MSFWSRMTNAIKSFREDYVVSDFLDPEHFEDFAGRRLRYQILWAWYENTAFRDIHTWAREYRKQYNLYKYIRNIYSPAFRLAEFWKMMIWGGLLTPEALATGSIPVVTTNEGLRQPLSKLWLASGWSVNKDLIPLWGASLGDVAIRVVDDVVHQEVRLEPIHPSSIKDLTIDSRGYCKGYVLEEVREDSGKDFTYMETVERGEGESVIFSTYRDGKAYGWEGRPPTWTEEYGFVPFVPIQHNNVGLEFGWAEVHPLRSKIHEIEDLGSKLHDYIRKAVDPIWLFNFKKPRGAPTESAAPSEAGRDETTAIYVPSENAKAQALISDQVDIQQTSAEIMSLLKEVERDFPELQMDIWTAGEDTSGRALRQARQRVETKVIQRRSNYDSALVRAQQMSIAIGGYRGYDGYQGFDLESYKKGDLNHTIDPSRPVFKTDPRETSEIFKMTWEGVRAGTDAGIPPEVMLSNLGWSDKQIADMKAALAEAERLKEARDRIKHDLEIERIKVQNSTAGSTVTGSRGEPPATGS